MEKYHNLAKVQSQLLSWMAHICLQQFRVGVLISMKKEILPEHHEALAGNEPFCWEYLTKITGFKLNLMSGNKAFQTPSKLASFLFEVYEKKRLQWENRPFRKLYQRARTGLNLRHGGQMAENFSDQVWQNLFKYHWVLPYPCADRWVYKIIEGKSKTKKGKGKERAIEEEVGGKLLRGKLLRGKLREKVKGQARKLRGGYGIQLRKVKKVRKMKKVRKVKMRKVKLRKVKLRKVQPMIAGNGQENHIKRDIQINSQDMYHGPRKNGKVGC